MTSELLNREYATAIERLQPGATDETVIAMLVEQHAWTDEGARTLLSLAQRHGVFVLRNALSLAEALGIEDGEAGL